MNRLQIYFISEVTFYKLLAQVTSSYIVIILQPFPSIDRSINLTAVLCLCYKSIVRVNRSENLTNFYLISEVTRLGDATLMLGRHNYDVGATQLRCWGDVTSVGAT